MCINTCILIKYVYKYWRETRTTGSNVPAAVVVVVKTAGVLSGALQDNGAESHEHSKVSRSVI